MIKFKTKIIKIDAIKKTPYYNELTKLNPEVVINDEIIKASTGEKIERKHIFSRVLDKLSKKVGKNECLVGNTKY